MALAMSGEGWYLTDEEWQIRNNMREFVEAEVTPRFKENFTEEQADPYYREIMKKVGELGMLRLTVPEELGGYGMRFTALLIAVEEMTRGCGALGIHVLENPLLGTQAALAAPKAWEKYGEGILDGSVIFASGMTAPEGNGNMSPMTWPVMGKREGDGWVVNGEKAFCSGGTFADALTVTGLTEDGKLGKWFFTPDTPGATIHHNPEVGNSPTYASLSFDNMYVEPGWGGLSAVNTTDPDSAAHAAVGYKAFAVGCAALSLGCMSAAWDETVEYLSNRDSLGKKVIEYGAIQAKLVAMKARMEAVRSMIYTTARMIEVYHKNAPAWADMVKILASDAARDITSQCVEMFGCLGINPEAGIMRHHLDAIGYSIGVGTPDLHYPGAAEGLGFPKSDDLNRC